jgi:hypothetical protein
VKLRAALLIALTLFASAAFPADLPTRQAAPQKDVNAKAQTCVIDGEQGILLPGTGTCIRLYGSLSAEVGAPSLSHPRAIIGGD